MLATHGTARTCVGLLAACVLALSGCTSTSPAGSAPSATPTSQGVDTETSSAPLLEVDELETHDGPAQVYSGAIAVGEDAVWRICPFFNESYPPSCEGTSLPLVDFDPPAGFESASGVRWTSVPMRLTGTVDSSAGVFVVERISYDAP